MYLFESYVVYLIVAHLLVVFYIVDVCHESHYIHFLDIGRDRLVLYPCYAFGYLVGIGF